MKCNDGVVVSEYRRVDRRVGLALERVLAPAARVSRLELLKIAMGARLFTTHLGPCPELPRRTWCKFVLGMRLPEM